MQFEFTLEPPSELAAGSVLDYRIGLGPIPISWRTILRRWPPPHGFVDEQARGPYTLGWHAHTLTTEGDATFMRDRVSYTLPLGVLGGSRIASRSQPCCAASLRIVPEAIERLFASQAEASSESAHVSARATPQKSA